LALLASIFVSLWRDTKESFGLLKMRYYPA
jgi:hypothetical protein